jgi:hypothetical protein
MLNMRARAGSAACSGGQDLREEKVADAVMAGCAGCSTKLGQKQINPENRRLGAMSLGVLNAKP